MIHKQEAMQSEISGVQIIRQSLEGADSTEFSPFNWYAFPLFICRPRHSGRAFLIPQLIWPLYLMGAFSAMFL